MQIDGQDVIVITREKLVAMAEEAVKNGAAKYYISEDKAGNVRFGALEEIPAHFRRKPLSLTSVKP